MEEQLALNMTRRKEPNQQSMQRRALSLSASRKRRATAT